MKNKIDFNKENILFISNEQIDVDSEEFKKDSDFNRQKIREKIEPWLTAVFQSEHLSLLVGSGLPIALTSGPTNPVEEHNPSKGNSGSKGKKSIMSRIEFKGSYKDLIKNNADSEAKKFERGEANFEDDLRIAIELLKGYEIQNHNELNGLKDEINNNIKELLSSVLQNEKEFLEKLNKEDNQEAKENSESNEKEEEKENNLLLLLEKFLLSFSTRTATRDRLNIFTTNYDRFIEFGLDEAGILTLDRFIGKLKPIMRFHRVDLDYHYNPPGIRGEPRYVEGVVRYTKLHGSIDWRFENGQIIKRVV